MWFLYGWYQTILTCISQGFGRGLGYHYIYSFLWRGGSGDCIFSCGGLGTAPSQAAVQNGYYKCALWTKDNVECVFTEYINTIATKYRPSLTRAHKDEFLKLEDITHHFRRPAIMDVKIGKRVWDDYAEQDKIERERKKYPDQEVIGFRIIGMRVSLSSTF